MVIPFNNAQSCPKLQVVSKGSKKEVKEIKGAEAIYEYLEQLNKKIRQVYGPQT